MKVFILNCNSALNSGDAAIMLGQLQFLEQRFPRLEIALTSRTPALDQEFFGPRGVKVFPPIIPAPSVFSGFRRKVRSSAENLFALRSKIALADEIKKSDLVISSGGGYFYSNRRIIPGPMFFQNYLHVKLALELRKPVIFFPQSWGPFYSPFAPALLRDILRNDRVLKIFTREKVSFDYLRGLRKGEDFRPKVEVCPDPAFYYDWDPTPPNFSPDPDLPRPIVALTLRQWDFPEVPGRRGKRRKQEEYLAAFEEIGRRIYTRWGGSVVLFPQVRGPGPFSNDRTISRTLWQRLRARLPEKNLRLIELADLTSPGRIIRLLSQVNLTIATRFHSAILSFLAGVPVISIAYQPKSRGIMEMMGFKRFCVDINRLIPEDILTLSSDILSRSDELRARIRREVSQTRKMIDAKLDDALNPFLAGRAPVKKQLRETLWKD